MGVGAGVGVPAAGEAIAVVVAGELAVMGDMPGAGEIPAVAGLVAVTGAAGGAPAGLVGGGVWPKEVHTSVTEQRLAISSVFIGLIGKFFPARIPIRISRSCLSSIRQV
jgi:hypothetical protein